jgi:hypothetical protein
MSNQRLPNEDDVHRVSDAEELVDPHTAHENQEEEPSTTTLPANEQEENAAGVVALSNEGSEEKSS